jgi:hypothetical protein
MVPACRKTRAAPASGALYIYAWQRETIPSIKNVTAARKFSRDFLHLKNTNTDSSK